MRFPNGGGMWFEPVALTFPEVETPHAQMLRVLADKGSAPLATLDAIERASLFLSMATTLTRAVSHRARFDQLLEALDARAAHFEGRVMGDTVAKYLGFEAGEFLGATRTFVDEVVYLAARRAGVDRAAADKWITHNLIVNAPPPPQPTPELDVLRSRVAWYRELNDYRNAMFHRGASEGLGYFREGSTERGADDPSLNIGLLPDQLTVKRPNRPDSWKYTEGRRLETLVLDVNAGLLPLVEELGQGWGGQLQARGSVQRAEGCLVAMGPLVTKA